MLANKIFIDLFTTNRSKEAENDEVAIVLLDEKIYTLVKRKRMFEMGLNNGCFMERINVEKPNDIIFKAHAFKRKYNLRFTSPEEFQRTEKVSESERIARAFALAEQHIRNS